jgi:hypothetical protein
MSMIAKKRYGPLNNLIKITKTFPKNLAFQSKKYKGLITFHK